MKSETAKSNVLSQADGFTDSNSKIRFHYDEMKIDFWLAERKHLTNEC
jgi:hypothetical protein